RAEVERRSDDRHGLVHAGQGYPGGLRIARAGRYRPMKGAAARIKVLLADDDAAYLESIRRLIESQPELSVIGQAADGLRAIELADEVEPDAAVIDVHMPLLDGITAIA